MSRLVAFAAIQGGYKVVSQVEGELEKALQSYDASTKIGTGAAIGAGCYIGPGVVVGRNVTIGRGSIIKANSVL